MQKLSLDLTFEWYVIFSGRVFFFFCYIKLTFLFSQLLTNFTGSHSVGYDEERIVYFVKHCKKRKPRKCLVNMYCEKAAVNLQLKRDLLLFYELHYLLLLLLLLQ